MPRVARAAARQPAARANSPGSASAVRRRCFSCRRTKTISAYFLRNLPAEIPVTVIGVGSNLIVRDGGVPGVVIRLGRGFNEIDVEDGHRVARRRRGARRHGGARGAEGRHRRAGVPPRHSRHHRRRAAHERRRLWRRDQGRAGRGARRRPRRAMCAASAMPRWAFPIATAACPTTSSSPARCSRAAPATPDDDRRRDGRDQEQARGEPAAQSHRRLDLQEPARP